MLITDKVILIKGSLNELCHLALGPDALVGRVLRVSQSIQLSKIEEIISTYKMFNVVLRFFFLFGCFKKHTT